LILKTLISNEFFIFPCSEDYSTLVSRILLRRIEWWERYDRMGLEQRVTLKQVNRGNEKRKEIWRA
jgi:hypothetical protein